MFLSFFLLIFCLSMVSFCLLGFFLSFFDWYCYCCIWFRNLVSPFIIFIFFVDTFFFCRSGLFFFCCLLLWCLFVEVVVSGTWLLQSNHAVNNSRATSCSVVLDCDIFAFLTVFVAAVRCLLACVRVRVILPFCVPLCVSSCCRKHDKIACHDSVLYLFVRSCSVSAHDAMCYGRVPRGWTYPGRRVAKYRASGGTFWCSLWFFFC